MGIETILLIVLILVLIGVFPAWPHSRNWGAGPTSIVTVVLAIMLILMLMGKI